MIETDPPAPTPLTRVLNIEVPLAVVIADRGMSVGFLKDMMVGSILEFEKNIEEPLELWIHNRRVARGDAVKSGERYGLQIREIVSQAETIRALGA